MLATSTLDAERLAKIIGRKLKIARNIADRTQSEVMRDIWGIDTNKNRISEIENGHRLPHPVVLVKLALYYQVSLDFIFGLSSDFENDLHTVRAGKIIQSMRVIGLDLMDNIGRLMADHVAKLPSDDAVLVNDSNKDLVAFLKKNIDENALFPEKKLRDEYLNKLELATKASAEFDYSVERYIRVLKMSVNDHVRRVDSVTCGEYLTDPKIKRQKTIEEIAEKQAKQQACLFDEDMLVVTP